MYVSCIPSTLLPHKAFHKASTRLLGSQEIDDPSDSKPADWVDDAKMDDPEASKPVTGPPVTGCFYRSKRSTVEKRMFSFEKMLRIGA